MKNLLDAPYMSSLYKQKMEIYYLVEASFTNMFSITRSAGFLNIADALEYAKSFPYFYVSVVNKDQHWTERSQANVLVYISLKKVLSS